MLKELEIRDFALVEHVQVSFTWGLNILTGETGAGKSIIMDALNAVLGGKVGPNVIRPQAEKAQIEATFAVTPPVVAWLKQKELIEDEQEDLTISREIGKSGSKLRINGTIASAAMVQELQQMLLTVHAQHEARTLMSAQSQLEMLDNLGNDEHAKLLSRVRTLYARKKDLEAALRDLEISEAERERRLDFARFQLNELNEADLEDDEELERLQAERQVLANVSAIEEAVSTAQLYLQGGESEESRGALDLLGRAGTELGRAAAVDQKLLEIEQNLAGALDSLEECSRQLRKYVDALDSDEETLVRLDDRIALLQVIKRKYGPTLAAALEKRNLLEKEVDLLENSQEQVQDLAKDLAANKAQLKEDSQSLRERRKKLAQKLSKQIEQELIELGMSACRFEIAFEELEFGPTGTDRVEFLIAPNPGQRAMPLAKIASGGELSRIMLAVKTIFAGCDRVATVLFDEIDTGMSGKVLQSMRDKLARLARVHQILCITHQPMIASVADHHIFVSKEQDKASTRTRVEILDEAGRLQKLAAMAYGGENPEAALGFARSLYEESLRIRASCQGP